jgi:hypothetical protein
VSDNAKALELEEMAQTVARKSYLMPGDMKIIARLIELARDGGGDVLSPEDRAFTEMPEAEKPAWLWRQCHACRSFNVTIGTPRPSGKVRLTCKCGVARETLDFPGRVIHKRKPRKSRLSHKHTGLSTRSKKGQ